MMTTRLSAKGQITIPKAIRSAHGWSNGLEFSVQETVTGLLLIPLPLFAETTLVDVIGCAGYQEPPISVEEMEAAIARGVRKATR